MNRITQQQSLILPEQMVQFPEHFDYEKRWDFPIVGAKNCVFPQHNLQ